VVAPRRVCGAQQQERQLRIRNAASGAGSVINAPFT
jgi:hypothetical protein